METPFSSLSRVMHEPNRLALMSALAAAVDGLSFGELKDTCNLTDGNLNRHLKALESDGIVSQRKETIKGGRPRTTITLTPAGRRRFVKYLENLEEVLQAAAAAIGSGNQAAPLLAPRPSRV
jgi:DNA-binding MarR family transcriptional regulator